MLVIKNGFIKTMAGEDIERGSVLIGNDGKILKVGKDIAPPAGAEVIDAGGRLVTPGCIDAHCHIGVINSAMRWEGSDVNEMSDPITPQMRMCGCVAMNSSLNISIASSGVNPCLLSS